MLQGRRNQQHGTLTNGSGTIWWGEATDEPARGDARPTESCKIYHHLITNQVVPAQKNSKLWAADKTPPPLNR